MRRMVAAEESTVWARACSSERTRDRHGIGREQHPHHPSVQVDDGPHGPRSGEEEHDAGEEDAEPVQEPDWPPEKKFVPKMTCGQPEDGGRGCPSLPIWGR